MRSRYSAFALGKGVYLVDTLSSSHADRALPPDLLARELGRVKDRQRFMGLVIVWAEGSEVLFHARVFEKGRDQSFAELSRFERDEEDGTWRYASGRLVPGAALGCSASELTRERFLAAVDADPMTTTGSTK